MNTILMSVVVIACVMGLGTLSFADEMGKMKGEIKGHEMAGEMKAKHDEMKATKDQMKNERKMKKDDMKGEMKMKKDEMKSDMKGETKGAMGH